MPLALATPGGRATATAFATAFAMMAFAMVSSLARHGGVASAVVSDAAPFRRPPPAGDARRMPPPRVSSSNASPVGMRA